MWLQSWRGNLRCPNHHSYIDCMIGFILILQPNKVKWNILIIFPFYITVEFTVILCVWIDRWPQLVTSWRSSKSTSYYKLDISYYIWIWSHFQINFKETSAFFMSTLSILLYSVHYKGNLEIVKLNWNSSLGKLRFVVVSYVSRHYCMPGSTWL
jgi:hypothetical protein